MSITTQLEAIADAGDDFAHLTYELTDRWESEPKSLDAVEAILRFMESHPEIEYGIPGPLVHFVEAFPFQGYKEKLIESVERRPTPHTVWMLNRVINGMRDPQERRTVILIMERVLQDPAADARTRERAFDFLEFQKQK